MPSNYAGNPANFPLVVQIPIGTDAPSSTVFATAYEGALDRTAWLAAHPGLGELVTLAPPFAWSVSSTEGPHAMCWDDTSLAVDPAAGQRWLALAWDSGLTHLQVYVGWADGNGWTQVGGNIAYTHSGSDIAVDSAGNIFVAGLNTSTSEADFYKCPPGGAFALFNDASGLTAPTTVNIVCAGTVMYFAIGSATAAQAQFATFGSGGVSGLTANKWILRSNGTTVIAIPGQAMSTPTVYKAVGSTFTNASIGLATTDIPQDATWSAALSMWVLVAKTSGGASTIWISADGATWSLLETLSHLPQPIVSIVAVGPYLVGAMANSSNGQPDQLCASTDGGVTWYALPTGTVIATNTVPKLVASPSQLLSLALVTVNSVTTGTIRAGGILGIGDQPLS